MIRVATILSLFTTSGVIIFFLSQIHICHSRPSSGNRDERLKLIRKLSKDVGFPPVVNYSNSTENPDNLCLTDGCLDVAEELLRSINGSVDPCSDFYQFACGGFIASNPIPPSETLWNNWSGLRARVRKVNLEILREREDPQDPKPVNQVKQFFKSCMDTEAVERVGLEPLKQLLNEILSGTNWPIMDPQGWNPEGFDWLKIIAEMRRRTAESVLLTAIVEPDNKDSKIMIVKVINFQNL